MPSLHCAIGAAEIGDRTFDNMELTDTTYEFKGDTLDIINAPQDTDWSRWGMLDDRKATRLYFFKQGSNEVIYQFIKDESGFHYNNQYPILNVTEVPESADVSHVGQLSTPNFVEHQSFNGNWLPVPNNYHVYMLDKPELQQDAKKLHQFIWARDTTDLKSDGITSALFNILPFESAEVDWKRWSINYDSNRYQLALRAYVFSVFEKGSTTKLYQARYNNLADPEAAYNQYPEIGEDTTAAYQFSGTAELINAPEGLNYDNFATVFDGVRTNFYFLMN